MIYNSTSFQIMLNSVKRNEKIRLARNQIKRK